MTKLEPLWGTVGGSTGRAYTRGDVADDDDRESASIGRWETKDTRGESQDRRGGRPMEETKKTRTKTCGATVDNERHCTALYCHGLLHLLSTRPRATQEPSWPFHMGRDDEGRAASVGRKEASRPVA
jgi:hypothetical protein